MYPFLGNGVTLQLIRRNQQCNVTEALAPVDINLQYDFNFQQFTFLPNEVQVLPVSTSESIIMEIVTGKLGQLKIHSSIHTR